MASSSEAKPSSRSKEAPGLLMSIVRTLSSSSDVEQREKEKAGLEKDYKDSDQKLNGLVQEHLPDLTSIIQTFSDISARITTSQEKIRSIRDSLQSCKNLLHCKRDELRKLWLEGIEYKTIVSMLDRIEKIKDVSVKLQVHLDQRQYLHATNLLVSSVSLLEGDLASVEALKDVRTELLAKKHELYELLLDELHKQIYVKSTASVVKGFQRQGSQRQSSRSVKGVPYPLPGQQSNKDRDAQAAAERRLASLQDASLHDIRKPQQVSEDMLQEPDDDPITFIAVLVESLGTLKKMPEAVDALRSYIKSGLMAIVQRSSQQVADNAYLEGEDLALLPQPQFLTELLHLLLQQFRIVARVHQIVLANMARVKSSHTQLADMCLYDMVEVWNKIQAVLQLVLSDYLDLRHMSSSQSPRATSFDEATFDLPSHFAKKRPVRPKKFALFRFDASSHAISMSSYLREQRQEVYGSDDILSSGDTVANLGKPQFVCKPCASNITVIYNPLQKFIKEVEGETQAASGSLTLHAFLTEFIKETFLGQVMYNVQTNIDTATKGFEAQKHVTDLRTQRELGVPKPLLQSTVTVARSIQELQDLMMDLPDYADQFLTMIIKVLQDYHTTCQHAYSGLVASESEDKRIISSTWAKDEDISRFLRSLPNWQILQSEAPDPIEMSEKDLRTMNSKESSILTSNLSSTENMIPQQEIISNIQQLKALGHFCESLEWFCSLIRSLVRSLRSAGNTPPPQSLLVSSSKEKQVPSVPDESLQQLDSLARELQGQAQLCLLVLHLEVRVHCFFHLMPLATSNYSGAIDDMDPDTNVVKLTKDLAAMDDGLQQALQPKRFRYVFDGLGHLVSSILINSTQYLPRINENGIKKMCRNIMTMQQCLTNITSSREIDLDHARQYYELLYLSLDDMLRVLVEHGPRYTELEYTALFQLGFRSRGSKDPDDLQRRLSALREFMSCYRA